MFFETDAIVLRSTKSINNDIFLNILTRKAGKMDVVANGAKSSKSQLAAASKPFVFGNFTLNTNSKTIKVISCEIYDSNFRIVDHLDTLAYGNYFLELCNLTSTSNVVDTDHYMLIVEIISILSKQHQTEQFFNLELLRLAYLIKLTKLTGHLPNLTTKCSNCGKQSDHFNFSIKNGGIICEACCLIDGTTVKLNSNAIKLIEYLLVKDVRIIIKTKIHENYIQLLLSIFEPFIEHYNNIYEIKSKSFLKEI